jgi:5'(3')-deoxyribonucleotidase
MRLDEIDQPIKKVVFTFGRMNPPHYGHGGVIKTLQTVAKQEVAYWYLFLSSKVEPAKNPLTYDQKCYWVKALFPETTGHLVEDASIKTPLIAATWLYKQGFTQATFVAGEDDMESYATMIKSGNEHGRNNPESVKMGKGFYFEKLDFAISPRLTTATKSRESITNNDPESFARNTLGGKVTNPKLLAAVEKQLFPLVRKGMQLESINEDADEDERRAFMMRPENQKDTPISNALKNYTPIGDIGKIGSAINKGEYGKALLPAAQLATNLIPGKIAATAASTAIGIGRGLTDESEELNKRTPSVRELAKRYTTTPEEVHRQINRGVKVEFEHTDDIEAATEIAMDHIGEKLDYYTRLAKVEEEDDDAVAIPGEPVSAAMGRMNARPDDQSKADFLGSYMKSALGQGGFTDGRFAQHTKDLKKKIGENFADGKGPGRPGDSQRHGIPKKASIAQLEKASHADGRKGQLARWQMNMRRGKKKANEGLEEEKKPKKPKTIIDGALKTLIAKGRSEDEAIADLKKEIDGKFYDLGESQLMELRGGLLQYIKQALPTWPEYVVRDWIYNNNKIEFSNGADIKSHLSELLKSVGLTPNSKWTLVPNLKFTMDMFEPWTQGELKNRAGGAVKDVVARDAERHATQATLAQQQGGVRKEPVILIKHPEGYELQEGWHRTIQHFAQFPNGYSGPAWVAMNAVSESLSESTDYSRGEELEGIDIMGAPVFITHHAIERLDRKGERSVDVEEIYEIIEKAVRQHGRDIANLHNTDFALKGENGPPREPKNGFGIALAKTEDSTGNTVYVIKTLHPTLLIGRMPGFKVQGLKRRYSIYEDAADESTKPLVYLDMDGVLADFFGEWSKISGVSHYRDIGNVEQALQLVRDHPTFWIDLPLLPNARSLVKTVIEKYGEYRICSTPLAGDERSKPGKIAWINKHFSDMPPVEIVLTDSKADRALGDGAPNILVDDYGVNISKWRAAGGIGIKYDDSAFPQVAQILTSIAKSGVVK